MPKRPSAVESQVGTGCKAKEIPGNWQFGYK